MKGKKRESEARLHSWRVERWSGAPGPHSCCAGRAALPRCACCGRSGRRLALPAACAAALLLLLLLLLGGRAGGREGGGEGPRGTLTSRARPCQPMPGPSLQGVASAPLRVVPPVPAPAAVDGITRQRQLLKNVVHLLLQQRVRVCE